MSSSFTGFKRGINVLAFQAYKKKFGNLLIPSNFIIPAHPTWPKATHNVPLGELNSSLVSTKANSITSDEFIRDAKELSKIGFNFGRKKYEAQIFLLAIRTYQSLYNSIDIPFSFVVPPKDTNWPEVVWNFPLGHEVDRVKVSNKSACLFASLYLHLQAFTIDYK